MCRVCVISIDHEIHLVISRGALWDIIGISFPRRLKFSKIIRRTETVENDRLRTRFCSAVWQSPGGSVEFRFVYRANGYEIVRRYSDFHDFPSLVQLAYRMYQRQHFMLVEQIPFFLYLSKKMLQIAKIKRYLA